MPERLYRAEPIPIQTPAAWGTAEAPPREFLVFRFGENRATLGGRREVVTLTAKNAASIVEEWRRRRIAGAFDYEHAVAAPEADKARGVPAAGWFSLAVRADGLWAVGISWTDRALAYFKGKEYRYFSPYFSVNRKGEVISLYNIALTNWPATDQQRPLIALSQATRRYSMDPQSIIRQISAYLVEKAGLAQDVADAHAAALYVIVTSPVAEPGADPMAEMPSAEMSAAPAPAPAETAIAQAAYSIFGTRNEREVLGGLKSWGAIVKERDAAVKELRSIKHTAEVEAAIKARKITPVQRAEALATDPDEFRGAMRWAQPILDTEEITAKSRVTSQAKAPSVEELEADPKLVAYCQRVGANVKLYAQSYAKLGVPFSE